MILLYWVDHAGINTVNAVHRNQQIRDIFSSDLKLKLQGKNLKTGNT